MLTRDPVSKKWKMLLDTDDVGMILDGLELVEEAAEAAGLRFTSGMAKKMREKLGVLFIAETNADHVK